MCQGRVQRRFFLTVCMLNLRTHSAKGRVQSRVSANSTHTLSAHRATDACAPTKKPCGHGTPGRLEDAKTACRAGKPSLLRRYVRRCACGYAWMYVDVRGCAWVCVGVRRCACVCNAHLQKAGNTSCPLCSDVELWELSACFLFTSLWLAL